MTIDNKDLLVGTLIGSAIGAAAVLLFTPKSGAKVRELVYDYVTGERSSPRRPSRPSKAHSAQRQAHSQASSRHAHGSGHTAAHGQQHRAVAKQQEARSAQAGKGSSKHPTHKKKTT